MTATRVPIVIVGGSVAGLRAARECEFSRIPWHLLESTDRVGGSLTSQRINGYCCDHRRPIVFEASNEWKSALDDPLFDSGPVVPMMCAVRIDSANQSTPSWRVIADPRRHPLHTLWGVLRRRISLSQFAAHKKFRSSALSEQDPTRRDKSVREWIESCGFESLIVDQFARPLCELGSIDSESTEGTALLAERYRLALAGSVSVWPTGAAGLTDAFAADLPMAGDSGIHLETPAHAVKRSETGWIVECGDEVFEADAVIIAARTPDTRSGAVQNRRTLHFAIPSGKVPTIARQGMVLFSNEAGPIHHAHCVTELSSDYAPKHRALFTVEVLREEFASMGKISLERAVRAQLASWFGADVVAPWRFLTVTPPPKEEEIRCDHPPEGDGLFAATCHESTPLISDELAAGRIAAERAITWIDQLASPR